MEDEAVERIYEALFDECPGVVLYKELLVEGNETRLVHINVFVPANMVTEMKNCVLSCLVRHSRYFDSMYEDGGGFPLTLQRLATSAMLPGVNTAFIVNTTVH